MNKTSTIKPVQHQVTVPLPISRAFELFADGFGTWWPSDHHIGAEEMATAVIEPRQGGRFYEIGESGAECDWGTVVAYDPPSQLVIAWQLNADWEFDPDITRASEVEVNFTEVDSNSTVVHLEHRNFDAQGARGLEVQEAVNGAQGWPGILQNYVEKSDR